MNNIQTQIVPLFNYPNESNPYISICKHILNESVVQYSISLEGYLGYTSIQEAIDNYKKLNQHFLNYLNEQNIEKNEQPSALYTSYPIKIVEENVYYMIFIDIYYDFDLYNLYHFLHGVISQLETIKENYNPKKENTK